MCSLEFAAVCLAQDLIRYAEPFQNMQQRQQIDVVPLRPPYMIVFIYEEGERVPDYGQLELDKELEAELSSVKAMWEEQRDLKEEETEDEEEDEREQEEEEDEGEPQQQQPQPQPQPAVAVVDLTKE
eukprot:tig00001387_g8570.t1